MQKGVVIEAGKKWTVVLTPDGQFCKVPTQPHFTEGMEVSFSIPFPVPTFSTKRIMSQRWVKSVSALCACLLLVILIFPFFSGNSAYAAVTIDINPSLELDVDKNATVIDVHPLNDEAKKVLEAIDWKKQKLPTVALQIIKAAETNGWMNNQNQVIITTTIYKNELNDNNQLDSQLEEVSSKVDQDITVVLVDGNKQWYDEAKKQSISPGSYMVVKQAQEQGINLNVAEVQQGELDELKAVKGIKVFHPKKAKMNPPGSSGKSEQPVNAQVEEIQKEISTEQQTKVKDNLEHSINQQQGQYQQSDQQQDDQQQGDHQQRKDSHDDEKQKKKIENITESNDDSTRHFQDRNIDKSDEHGKKNGGKDKGNEGNGKSKKERD